MSVKTTDGGVVKGKIKGHLDRHTVAIHDYTHDTSPIGVPDEHQVWVGSSPKGEPFIGAYVSRKKFLKMVAKVFNVATYEVGYREPVRGESDPIVWTQEDVGYHA